MAEIVTRNITARHAGLEAGERVYECDDGTTPATQIKLKVTARELPGAVVWVPQCCCCDEDGERDLGIAPHEVTFMLGESDADPATVFEALMAEQARRAHRAKRQLDGLAALGLPVAPSPVRTVEKVVPRRSASLSGGAGNDLLQV